MVNDGAVVTVGTTQPLSPPTPMPTPVQQPTIMTTTNTSCYNRCLPIIGSICCIIVAICCSIFAFNLPSFTGINVILIFIIVMLLSFSCACYRLSLASGMQFGGEVGGGAGGVRAVIPPPSHMPNLSMPPPYSTLQPIQYHHSMSYSQQQHPYAIVPQNHLNNLYGMRHSMQWNAIQQWNSMAAMPPPYWNNVSRPSAMQPPYGMQQDLAFADMPYSMMPNGIPDTTSREGEAVQPTAPPLNEPPPYFNHHN